MRPSCNRGASQSWLLPPLLAALLVSTSLAHAQTICASCHPEIAKSYRETGMGRSFGVPDTRKIPEHTLYHAPSQRYYSITQHGGALYQIRYQIGFNGEKTNILEKQADYVIGSGNHARSYLHRTKEGKLVELPVSWYSEQGGYWAMSPGYDHAGQDDFRRVVSYECLFCHNAYPSPEPGVSYTGTEPVFGKHLPDGIDCERCHGSGAAHVAAATSGRASVDAIRKAIVNPASLSRDRQLEICMQCHLETTSSPLPHAIRRYNRAVFSYLPGEPLGNYILNFDRGSDPAFRSRFEIAHAAYRLRMSACFTRSQLTCTTCHDPHRALRGKQATAHFISVCKSCHTSAHQSSSESSGNCLDCHMPKRHTDDAVHVVMTDHYIRARSDLAQTGGQGEVALYYPPRLPDTPENRLYLAVAQVADGTNLQAGVPRLQQLIDTYKPARPEFYFELGEAYSKEGKPREAIAWYEQALLRQPDFLPATKRLIVAMFAAGEVGRAVDILERATRQIPDAVLLANLGNAYLRQGKLTGAEEVLQQSLRVNPDSAETYNLFGLLRLRKRDAAGAQTAFRTALQMNPDLAEAHSNLANLLASTGNYREAEYEFAEAIRCNPASAEAHHSYALLLELRQAYPQALEELQKAVQLNPHFALAYSDLGDLLAAQGRIADAIAAYKSALQANPNLTETRSALAKLANSK